MTTEPLPGLNWPTDADQEAKQKAFELWGNDRAWLVFHSPFMASLAMQLDVVPVVDCRLPTAATDGERIFVNPYFLFDLTDEERVFVLAHEVWHCALLHLVRRGGRSAELWNIAIDHEVNALLLDEQLTMPNDGVYFKKWHGLNAEEVYEHLEAMAKSALPERSERADKHLEPGHVPEPTDGKIDPDYGPFVCPKSMERWPARVVAAAQQRERAGGTLPGALHQLVQSIREPTVDWRTVLRQFVTQVYGGSRQWLPPNRRHLWRGIYLPAPRQEKIRLVVALDTSGSTQWYLPQFVTELHGLLHSFGEYEATVIQCDAEIQSVETYTSNRPLPSALDNNALEFLGGGGTSFVPVFNYLADQEPPNALVYLTDGYGDAPENAPSYPVLWALTPDGEAPANWGQVVSLEIEEERDA